MNTLYITTKDTGNIIRGLGALGVMGSHITVSAPWFVNMLFPGRLWVAIFFFFTGYGLTYSFSLKGDTYFEDFIKKKVFKIYIPFVIAETVYVLSKFLLGTEYTIEQFLLKCSGIYLENTVLWYVIELLGINFLFYLNNHYIINKFRNIILADIISTLLIYIVFLIFAIFLDLGNWWYISTSGYILCVVAYYYKDRILKIIDTSWFINITTISFILLYSLYIYIIIAKINTIFLPRNYVLTLLCIVLAPLFIFLLAIFFQKFNIHSKILNYLGKISFDVYLWHMLCFLIVRKYFESWIIVSLITVIATLIISYFSNKLFFYINNKI